MPVFTQFTTPAGQSARDFAGQPPGQQAAFEQAWSSFVNASVETARLGNPWNSANDSPRALYFNPLGMDLDETKLPTVPVQWTAFPNRLNAYLYSQPGKYGLEERWRIADTGVQGLQAPANPCAGPTPLAPFGPQGPRGWQDEYCEWAVTRENDDPNGKITSVMFTCENPEYWFLLWNVSPARVASLYQQTLGVPVPEADLYLLDAQGQPVTDPQTGRPAYNPINKWNHGTAAGARGGGALHLTSPPNSLGAEVYLAAAATIQRYNGPAQLTNAADLICCAQYGALNRNSDPHIGQNVNAAVGNNGQGPLQVTLLNPVGLYLQLPYGPSFNGVFTPPAGHRLPAGRTLMDCWQVRRGVASYPGYPNDAALHLVFEVPAAWGFAVGDIQMSYSSVQGEDYDGPVKYGAQLVEFLQVQLAAVAQPATQPLQKLACVQAPAPAAILPAPGLLLDAGVYQASLFNQLDQLSNLTPQMLTLRQGETRANLVLQVQAAPGAPAPGISFSGPGVTVSIDQARSTASLYYLTVAVAPDAAVGQRSLLLSQGEVGVPAPGYLQINPAGASGPAPVAQAAPAAATAAAPAAAPAVARPAVRRLGRA